MQKKLWAKKLFVSKMSELKKKNRQETVFITFVFQWIKFSLK